MLRSSCPARWAWHCIVYSLFASTQCSIPASTVLVATELTSLYNKESARTLGELNVDAYTGKTVSCEEPTHTQRVATSIWGRPHAVVTIQYGTTPPPGADSPSGLRPRKASNPARLQAMTAGPRCLPPLRSERAAGKRRRKNKKQKTKNEQDTKQRHVKKQNPLGRTPFKVYEEGYKG